MKRILFTLILSFFLATPNFAQNKRFIQAITGGHSILLGNPTSTTNSYNLFDTLATVVDSVLSELINRGINPYNYAGLSAAYTQAVNDGNFLFIPAIYSTDSSVTYTTAPIIDFRNNRMTITPLSLEDIYFAKSGTLSDLIVANQTTVVIDTFTLTTDLNMPANSRLMLTGNGFINGSGYGDTLTIDVPFWSENKRVFGDSITVKFGKGSNIDEVNALWFGADPTDAITSTQQRIAIQRAIDASDVGDASRVNTFLPLGTYTVDSTLYFSGTTTFARQGLRGEGIQMTIIRLANSANDVILKVGGSGASEQTNNLLFSDFTVYGNKANQATANAGIEFEECDQCLMERVAVDSTKGTGIAIIASSIRLSDTQVYRSDSCGVLVDGSTSVFLSNNYLNFNKGYGVRVQHTNTEIAPTRFTDHVQIESNHFEQNEKGEIVVNNVDNVVIVDNTINPHSTLATNFILFKAKSRFGKIVRNTWQTNGADYITDEDGSPAFDKNFVKFEAGTEYNYYEKNLILSIDDFTSDTVVYRGQIYDLGNNFSIDPLHLAPRFVSGREFAHQSGGFIADQVTNYIPAADYTDFTTANWDTANIVSRSNVSTVGNPVDPAGNATQVDLPGSSYSVVFDSIKSGLAVVSGDLVTFQVYARLPSWTEGERTDIRLEVRDASGTTLSQDAFRIKAEWELLATQFRSAATHDTLIVEIGCAAFADGLQLYLSHASLHEGGIVPAIYGGDTAKAGLVAMSGRFHGEIVSNNASSFINVKLKNTLGADGRLWVGTGDNNLNFGTFTNNQLAFHTNSTQRAYFAGDGGLVLGSPTGTSKGTGTINLDTAYFLNGDFKFVVFADTLCAVKISTTDTVRIVPSR